MNTCLTNSVLVVEVDDNVLSANIAYICADGELTKDFAGAFQTATVFLHVTTTDKHQGICSPHLWSV